MLAGEGLAQHHDLCSASHTPVPDSPLLEFLWSSRKDPDPGFRARASTTCSKALPRPGRAGGQGGEPGDSPQHTRHPPPQHTHTHTQSQSNELISIYLLPVSHGVEQLE